MRYGCSRQPIHVLLIEDDLIDARKTMRLLQDSYLNLEDPVHAYTLEDAFLQLKQHAFDVVLLDLVLPDAQGVEIIHRIRSLYPTIPIVIITGTNDDAIGLEAIAQGAEDYLAKDTFDQRQLTHVVRYAIERKHLEIQRDQERQNLLKIFEAAPVGMLLLNSETVVVQANTTVATMVGKTISEMVKQRGGGSFNCIHSFEDVRGCGYGVACSCCVLRNSVETVFKTGKEIHHVDMNPTLLINGKEQSPWLCFSAEPVWLKGEQHVVVAFTDITQRKQTEEALRKSEYRFRRYFDLGLIGMAITSREKGWVEFNDTLCEMFGYTRSELARLTWSELTHPDDLARDLDQFTRACAGEIDGYTLEKRFIHKEGYSFYAEISANVLRKEDGSVDYFVALVQNIDERKNAEVLLKEAKLKAEATAHQLASVNLELEAAMERAQVLAQEAIVANQVKSQFLSNMSHEIRTPLNSVLGFTDVLMAESLTDEQREYVDIIRSSGEGLLELVNSILGLSQLEADRYEVKISECYLDRLFVDLKTMFVSKSQEKGIELVLNLSENLPETIHTDVSALRQCLINLIDNGIKFTDKGRVTVHCDHEPLRDQTSLCITVEDTGIGIEPEKQALIFEQFLQGDGASTRRHGGTGLGLALTKRLVDFMGGDISLTSTPNAGSCFLLKIPCQATKSISSLETVDGDPLAREEMDCTAFTNVHVLVAEDSYTNARLVRHVLEAWNLDVTVVRDGKQVTDRDDIETFDVVLMDLQMPVKDGYQTTTELRDQGYELPIIALTANATDEDRKRCLANGFNEFLTKPFDKKVLFNILKKYLPTKVTHEVKAFCG